MSHASIVQTLLSSQVVLVLALQQSGFKESALWRQAASTQSSEVHSSPSSQSEGAQQAPGYKLLSETIKAGCRIAIKLSERI